MSITEHEIHDNAGILDDEHEEPTGRHPGNVLDHVRARRDELARQGVEPLILEVPGDALGIRCEWPESGADGIVRAYEQSQRKGKQPEYVTAASRAIALCCGEVLGRLPGGAWEPLDPTDERPLRFNERLAGLLGIEVPNGKPSAMVRHIVRNVFSPRAQTTGIYDGDMALLDRAGDLIDWLRGGLQDTSEELEGE